MSYSLGKGSKIHCWVVTGKTKKKKYAEGNFKTVCKIVCERGHDLWIPSSTLRSGDTFKECPICKVQNKIKIKGTKYKKAIYTGNFKIKVINKNRVAIFNEAKCACGSKFLIKDSLSNLNLEYNHTGYCKACGNKNRGNTKKSKNEDSMFIRDYEVFCKRKGLEFNKKVMTINKRKIYIKENKLLFKFNHREVINYYHSIVKNL